MECRVTKDVYLVDCSEDEAYNNPWDFATQEVEIDQIDWEVKSVKEDK